VRPLLVVADNRRLDEWVSTSRILRAAALPSPSDSASTRLTRGMSERHDAVHGQTLLSIPGVDPEKALAAEAEHGAVTRVKNVDSISFGPWDIKCWYYSPFPEGYARVDKLFFHPTTLRYFSSSTALQRHTASTHWACPPGREVYRDPRPGLAWSLSKADALGLLPPAERCEATGRPLSRLSVFEVDGAAQRLWCRNLCLLSKLFLDHKTLYFDVDPFLFYVLCEVDDGGHHQFVGYFSKEKSSPDGHNLACILVLPPFQGSGYSKVLISLSYALSRAGGELGTPEKPLSDLGRVSYLKYWQWAVLRVLAGMAGVSDNDLCGLSPSSAAAPVPAIVTPAFTVNTPSARPPKRPRDVTDGLESTAKRQPRAAALEAARRLDSAAAGCATDSGGIVPFHQLPRGVMTDVTSTVEHVALATGISAADVTVALRSLGFVRYRPGGFVIDVHGNKVFDELVPRWSRYRHREVSPAWLRWTSSLYRCKGPVEASNRHSADLGPLPWIDASSVAQDS
jgi:histone acetyltransferase MYST1